MRAHFWPQAWVNNYAIDVDSEGDTEWEITPEYAATLPEGWEKENTYESDELRHDPAAPEWVQNWHGPFYVSLIEEEENGTDAQN